MPSHAANNKRIAKNTVALYVRMMLVMLVTLYSARVVLQALGAEDYGIYNVVGGVVAMLGFFSSSLSNVTQRYINIGLGKKDTVLTEHVFRQSFTLLFVISIAILIAGETIGLWFVYDKLVIPPERMNAALWVYQCSLLSVFFSFNQIPQLGAIVAHERMGIYAYLGVFEAVAQLGIAYLLIVFASSDALMLYGTLRAIISLLLFVFYSVYARRSFAECRFRLYWNKPLVEEMSRFIGYNIFGCFSCSAGSQGTNILLNLFFGPTVNAARAIAYQVASVVGRFTESITTAVKPQIIQSYVANDRDYMKMLMERSSKYLFFLAAILVVPIITEIHFILDLWLVQVPEYTVVFTRLVLCEALFGVFVPPLWMAANATGDIKHSQVYGRLFTLAVLPISYVALRFGASPEIPMAIAVLGAIGYWLYNLQDIHRQIQLSRRRYFRKVVMPAALLVVLLALACGAVVTLVPEETFSRVALSCLTSVAVGLVVTGILLDKGERAMAYKVAHRLFHRNKTLNL